MLELIVKYWVNWLCVLVAGGITLFVKHYVKLQKNAMEEKIIDREKHIYDKMIETLDTEIAKVETQSQEEDDKLHAELECIHQKVKNMESGILSIQGRQFRDNCEKLLEKNHYITVDEYEELEAEYEVYKGLGGNHRGDALHDRVVDKVQAQMCSENCNLEE